MLFLVLTLLVAMPPVFAAGLLAVQSVLLWRRRKSVRIDIAEAARTAGHYLDARGASRRFANENERRAWRLGEDGDFENIWWRSPFDFVTLDDYMSDVFIQSKIDRLAREIAAQHPSMTETA
jgi:hypothetical protein